MEHAQPTKRKMLRVTLAGVFGTTLEFYDHFIYGSAAALVFPHVFFVQMSPSLALLLSLVTYSVAFVARPLGAVVFGHFGDRYGRKNVLIAALLMMGVSTFLIGCLPSYAIAGSFGATALCFLRLFQGIALGGEWGGAALIVNEYARDSKAKGLLGSVPLCSLQRGKRWGFCWRAPRSRCSPTSRPRTSCLPGDGASRFWPAPCSC